MFFDDHPDYYDSPVGATRERLRRRYEAIIGANLEVLNGARVIDVGAHDGRWSAAAIGAGARTALAMEGRKAAFDAGRQRNPWGTSLVMVAGDILQKDLVGSFDVGLVLGILYHVPCPWMLLNRVAATGVNSMIIDTNIQPGEHCAVRLVPEDVGDPAMSLGGLGCLPTVPALEAILQDLGFHQVKYYDWNKTQDWTGLPDYERRTRVTLAAWRT